MKSKIEIGNDLELYVSQLFKEIYPYSRPTKGSGNKGQIGDCQQPYFIIECKHRSTDSITLNKKVWDKLLSEIPPSSLRVPLYVLRNKHNQVWAVLDIRDFIRIFKRSIKDDR